MQGVQGNRRYVTSRHVALSVGRPSCGVGAVSSSEYSSMDGCCVDQHPWVHCVCAQDVYMNAVKHPHTGWLTPPFAGQSPPPGQYIPQHAPQHVHTNMQHHSSLPVGMAQGAAGCVAMCPPHET